MDCLTEFRHSGGRYLAAAGRLVALSLTLITTSILGSTAVAAQTTELSIPEISEDSAAVETPRRWDAFPLPAVGSNAQWEETYQAEDRFPPPPRDLARALTRGYQAYAAGEMSEALGWLLKVVDRPSQEDFLLRGPQPPNGQPPVVSLSWAAHCLLCALPARQRELFALQFDATARRALEEARENRSLPQLTEIVRRYLYTSAGQEAALLLGYEHFQSGRVGLASSVFRRLRMVPEAEKQEPGLGLALAISYYRSGELGDAIATLKSLKWPQDQPVSLWGKVVSRPSQDEDWQQWLASVAPPSTSVTAMESQWLLAGGEPHRLGSRGGGFPMEDLRWELPLINHVPIEKAVSQQFENLQSQRSGLSFVSTPLVIDQTVVVRSFHRIMAIDLKAGKRIWYYPAIDELGPQLGTIPETAPPSEQEIHSWLRRQAGADDLASDGQRVYFLEQTESQSALTSGIWINGGRSLSSGSNRLVALDLKRQGSLSWIVGGQDSSDPALAEAFFLGAPLPIQDQLYAIVWLDGLVQLVQLDAETGKLQWQQALATVESVVRLDDGSQQSLSPAYANGVLVCPTGLGVVVGLDLATGDLQWGVHYPTTGNVRSFSVSQANEQRWIGPAVQIAGNQVLITAQESDHLYCVDLLTGQSVWEQPDARPRSATESRRRRRTSNRLTGLKGLPRDQYQMIAAVNDDLIVTMGKSLLRGIRRDEGVVLWERQLDLSQQIAGPGFFDQQTVWLPNDQGQVMAVRIADGQPMGLIVMPWQIQSIICTQRDMLAVGLNHVGVFFRGQVAADLFQRLDQELSDAEKSQLPPQVLVFRGQLLRYQQQWDQAIQVFDQIWRRSPSTYHQRLLTDTLLEAMADGHLSDDRQLEPYGEMLQQRDRVAFAMHQARGLLKQNQVRAVLPLLQLCKLPGDLETREPLLDSPQNGQLSWKQWTGQQIQRLVNQPEHHQAALDLLREDAQQCLLQNQHHELFQRMLVLGSLGMTDRQQRDLAEWLLQQYQWSEAQWVLSPLIDRGLPDAIELGNQLLQRTGLQNAGPLNTDSRSANWTERDWRSAQPKVQFQFDVMALSQQGSWAAVQPQAKASAWNMGVQTRWRPNDHLLEVYDSWGRQAASLVLEDLAQRRLDPRLTSRRYDWGLLSLHQFGNELVMMDWTRIHSPSSTPRLWVRDLANTHWPLNVSNRLGAIRSAVENDEQGRYRRMSRDSFGAVSNISQNAVIVHTGPQLICLHPLTGQLKWQRSVSVPVRAIWHNDESVYVLQDDGQCVTLDSASGDSLGERSLETLLQGESWVVGKYLIFRSDSGQHEIQVQDLTDAKVVWANQGPSATPSMQVHVDVRPDLGQLVCLSNSGWAQILNLSDGRLLAEVTVEPATRTGVALNVAPGGGWLISAKNRDLKNWQRPVEGVTSMPIPESGETLDADLYYVLPADGVSRKTGWIRPLQVRHYSLVETAMQQAPFLLFASRASINQGSQRSGEQCHLALVDLRNASLVLEKTVPMAYRLGLEVDPERQILTVAAGTYTGTLQWSAMQDPPPRPDANLDLIHSLEFRSCVAPR